VHTDCANLVVDTRSRWLTCISDVVRREFELN